MKTFEKLTDTQLVHLFQKGSGQALEVLVNRHKDKIFTSILLLVKDKQASEDIFQNVFIRIIDTLRNKGYNDEGKFLSWAVRVAHNMCVDYFRKENRKPKMKSTDEDDYFSLADHADQQVDTRLIRCENQARVVKLVDLLPAEQREVIVLRHFAGLSFKEISKITNCSINTSLGRMRYGLINLRKMMTEKQFAL